VDPLDDIVAEFLSESYENLDQLDRDLVALEQDPSSRPLLASIFRTVHTVKGTCGFLGFAQLEKVTHVGENLLSRLRDGELTMTVERTDVLLRLVDAIRNTLQLIERTGSDEIDHAELIEALVASVEDAPATEPAAPPQEQPKPAGRGRGGRKRATAEQSAVAQAAEQPATTSADAAADAADDLHAAVRAGFEPDDPDPEAEAGSDVASAADAAAGAGSGAVSDATNGNRAGTDNGKAAAPPAKAGTAGADRKRPEAGSATPNRRSLADSTVRVDVDLLDSLMRLVGELVLTRNQIATRISDTSDTDLVRAGQRLDLIAGELQEGVMKTRMQALDTVWSKLPRVVRDLATTCGRQVRLELSGGETELDRTVLEAVKDPLTHLVRNAVDHGIEPPEARRAAGKPAEGTLRLSAFHEGGRVHIEIGDDGVGIDPARVGRKAVERGLVSETELDRMSDDEVLDLIFLPGFSTAQAVSTVSGRGVGMDVVKTNIENIGGSVSVSSVAGEGTHVRVTIPLTLAIIPALILETGGRRYAVAQASVVELVSVGDTAGSGASHGIETVAGAPVYRLRGRLLPVVHLTDVLAGHRATGTDNPGSSTGATIAVLQADGHRFGLVVDQVVDTEEIVVTPMSPQLKHITEYAGATILGSGRVALIIDVTAIARSSGVVGSGNRTGRSRTTQRALEEGVGGGDAVDPYLIIEVSSDPYAVPLSAVTRLEEIDGAGLEHAGGREVVRYRGRIMPLIRMSSLLGNGGMYSDEATDGQHLNVIVHTVGDRSVGLVVDAILDITDARPTADSSLAGPGTLGSVVLGDRVIQLVDIQSAVMTADPTFFAYSESYLHDDRSAGPDPDAPILEKTLMAGVA
jgi:two-component system chemotaxis sensor kinase CheA